MQPAQAKLEHPRFLRSYRELEDLKKQFNERRDVIRCRLSDFKALGEGPDEDLFAELCFCLLTPQSKAKACDKAVRALSEKNLLLAGTASEIALELRIAGVRFHNGKARWIAAAREEFHRDGRWTLSERLGQFKDSFEARDWLASNVMGLGYKEAAHFLRNIGSGDAFAILDRHIMRNLHRHGVMDKMPDSLSKKEYLRIESLMRDFSAHIGISLAELDLLFWSRETGEVFK